MTNETKTVKEVFKDYDTQGKIQNAEITNVSMFKKSNRLVIDLKSTVKIGIGEKLEFEYYLKSKFRVQEVQINIEEISVKQTNSKKASDKPIEDNSPFIIGNKKQNLLIK